jgi:hypothetical protein
VPPRGPSPPRPSSPALGARATPPMVSDRDAIKRLHDGWQTDPSGSSHPRSFVPGTRTRAEARVVYREGDEDAKEIATPTRRFSVWETANGFPDDSREADEAREERYIRDLRDA